MISYIKNNWKSLMFYLGVIAFSFILSRYILLFARIPSSSMENTLQIHDHLIANRLSYINHDPERGDIIIFIPPIDDDYYIKRVIGLPGETVTIGNGVIYINGKAIDEPYVKEPWVEDDPEILPEDVTELTSIKTFVVPENSYFVMGDNRMDSLDSRYWAQDALDQGLAKNEKEAIKYSFVKRDKILAKAIFKYFKGFEMLN